MQIILVLVTLVAIKRINMLQKPGNCKLHELWFRPFDFAQARQAQPPVAPDFLTVDRKRNPFYKPRRCGIIDGNVSHKN
jgi:hypothetical protein